MKWLRVGLEIVGALSLLLLLVGAVWIVRQGTSDKVNRAKREDALFILNYGGIATNQNFKVIASYESARSFTGDHLDYYCIELPKFEIADYAKQGWHDGPEKNPLLVEALKLGINDVRAHTDCFPSADEANSEAVQIMFGSVTLHGQWPTAADIILYEQKRNRLYYVSYKT